MRETKMLSLVIIAVLMATSALAETPKDKNGGLHPTDAAADSVRNKSIGLAPGETLPRCAIAARALAGPRPVEEEQAIFYSDTSQDAALLLTGDLHMDLLAIGGNADPRVNPAVSDGRRNPALAFGLSAVVPGLGQAYNKSWVRAAIAGALEIGLWAGYFTWRGQGREGEIAYQAFAHRDWSVYRYGAWLNQYPGYAGADLDILSIEGIDFMNPGGWSADEQQRVDAFFEELRAAERLSNYNNMDGSGTGASFSHVLPDHGDQQYYELIGKYFQYGAGWSDWCSGRDPNDASCFSIEGFAQIDDFAAKTTLFFDYASDHADANSLLRRASRITSIVVANHALAAIDALLTARFHNRGLTLESSVSLRQEPSGAVSPVANLRLTF